MTKSSKSQAEHKKSNIFPVVFSYFEMQRAQSSKRVQVSYIHNLKRKKISIYPSINYLSRFRSQGQKVKQRRPDVSSAASSCSSRRTLRPAKGCNLSRVVCLVVFTQLDMLEIPPPSSFSRRNCDQMPEPPQLDVKKRQTPL